MHQLKTMNAEELSELPFPSPAFIVKELIPHGLSVLAGADKTGKSWLVLWLAMRVSQGLPVWERPTQQCEVLYLCLEDTFPRIQRRMYRLNEDPVPERRFAVMCDKLHGGQKEQIAQQLRSHPHTGLVIIDTLQKIRDRKDAESGNMYACDYDAIIVIIFTGNMALVASGHFDHLPSLNLWNAVKLTAFQFQVVKLTT